MDILNGLIQKDNLNGKNVEYYSLINRYKDGKYNGYIMVKLNKLQETIYIFKNKIKSNIKLLSM